MQIRKTETIAGYPALVIRNLLRRTHDTCSIRFVAQELQVSEDAAERLIRELVRLGFLMETYPGEARWHNSIKGNALAMATTAPVSRTAADRALAAFLERVTQVNAPESPFAFRVKTVVLFGSYLGTASRVGDVDLAVELQPRLDDRKAQDALEDSRRDSVPTGFRSFFEELIWPQQEVRKFLKSRSRIPKIGDMDNLAILETDAPVKVLVGTWDRSPRRRG